MQVVYSPSHLGHDITHETFMGVLVPANEVAERAEIIRLALDADGGFPRSESTEHGEAPITAVHDPGLVRFLEEAWSEVRRQGVPRPFLTADTYPNRSMFEGMTDDAVARHVREPEFIGGRAGFWGLDSAAPLVAGTYVAARGAVDVALTTVDLVLDGGAQAAYGLCRPPGHHAARSMYGGYCFFNNAAIAAEAITARTGERVAILDVDYHHGNGSQQIFWRRGDVRYVSIHAHPDRQYPYFLGREDETGEGEGSGENLNLPLPSGRDQRGLPRGSRSRLRGDRRRARYRSSSCRSGSTRTGWIRSATFALTTDVYHEVGRRVAALGRRLVVLQEGGYHRPSLGENARAWLRGAEGRPFEPLPAVGFTPGGSVV